MAVDPWAEFNPTPAPPPIQQGSGADPWAEFNPTGGGNEPSIAARANVPPQPDPLMEQRRRFEAMNPQEELKPFTPAASFNTQPLIPGLPQSVRDFSGLASNEFSMAASPTLREQAPAERARLGPLGSGVAETLGYYASPTTVLNAVPYVGGALAGGLHEGIKSKFEGDDWTTAAEKTGKGAFVGALGTGAARVLTSPSVVSKLVDIAGTGGAGAIAHALFAQSPMAGWLGANMGRDWARPAVKWAEEKSGPLLEALRPYVAAGIQGTASAVEPKQGWSQWWTGQ